MTTPVNPNDPSAVPPVSASSAGAPTAGNFSSDKSIDPSGVWSKFLSTPGHPATAKDVQMFIQGLMKSFGVLIQQNQRAMERAKREMKRAEKGE
jgi:hypothetical protein